MMVYQTNRRQTASVLFDIRLKLETLLFYGDFDGLARAADSNHVDFAAAFALCCDFTALADCCDLLVAADIPKLRCMACWHEFLALIS